MNEVPQGLLMQMKELPENCGYLWPLQSLFRHIQFKGVLCIRTGSSSSKSNCNYSDLRVGSQLKISLCCKKMMIKTRRGLAEQRRNVKTVENLLDFKEPSLSVGEKVKRSVSHCCRFLYKVEILITGWYEQHYNNLL